MSVWDIDGDVAHVMRLIPKEDEGEWVAEQGPADDAAASLAYALRCRQSGASSEAAWAARRAYEAMDYYAGHMKDNDCSYVEAEEDILSHPMVQAELGRQERDLRELESVGAMGLPEVMEQLKTRAQAEAQETWQARS